VLLHVWAIAGKRYMYNCMQRCIEGFILRRFPPPLFWVSRYSAEIIIVMDCMTTAWFFMGYKLNMQMIGGTCYEASLDMERDGSAFHYRRPWNQLDLMPTWKSCVAWSGTQ
jgi:hypothetical protein